MQNRTAVILGSLLLAAGSAFAQAPATDQQQPTTPQTEQAEPMQHNREARPGMMQAQWLAQKLNLSQDQLDQIKPILAEQRQQMQALRADTSLSLQDRQAKAEAIRQDSKTKIEALLNDSQKQQFQQILAARLRRAQPEVQSQWLARKLELSQDQVAQITPILTEQRHEMRALRADTSLSIQDRQAKAKAVRQDAKAKIEAQLNDSQKQQFEQMLAAARARRQHYQQQQRQPAQNQPGV